MYEVHIHTSDVSPLQGVWVEFVHEGHQVRVTGAKRFTAISYTVTVYQDKSACPQCDNSNNSASVTHRAVKYACSIGYSAMANRIA